MKIWIDFANSPHIPFFRPLLPVLKERGHDVCLTLREFAQTVPLARKYGLEGDTIGGHGGRGRLGKLTNLVRRSTSLAKWARRTGVNLAVSHNSYTQILAARLAGKRAVTLMDYEGQPANHLAFRVAQKVIVPEHFPDEALRKFGARQGKVYKYPGFKEQLYLSDFEPDGSFLREMVDALHLSPDWGLAENVLVTVRTPATMATYHRFQNPLFDELLVDLNGREELTVVCLPRTDEQKSAIRSRFPNLKIPDQPLDGNNLMSYSDLVISAGGTMNREAAILGTPAYTIFAGRVPAVDARLIEMGRMTRLFSQGDLKGIRYEKKGSSLPLKNTSLREDIVSAILE
jgi:predicted glycosyltransferase